MSTSHPLRLLLALHRDRRFFFAFLVFAIWAAPFARANVCPTNLRLNGGTNNVALAAGGGGVTLNYLLNEPASSGVTIAIKSGATTIRTITRPGGGAGTLREANSVVWDGKDNASNNVPGGTYSIQITAATAGYGDWSQISSDLDIGSYVFAPRGIAVNRNTNSLYYGRVFVSNGQPNQPSPFAGDAVGILKFNGDSTAASDGAVSTGGWPWAGNGRSPWKLEVSPDDYVYVNDWTSNGVVLRFNQAIATNSQTVALRNDNWPNGGASVLSGPFITSAGPNLQVWMADTNFPGSVGIRRWTAGLDGTIPTNNLGTTIVQATTNLHLSAAPYDIAVDRSNRIYTIQFREDSGDTNYRVMRFPAYLEGGPALSNSNWRIGSGDDNLRSAVGIAVNPAATIVAVAFAGAGAGVRIFNANDGSDAPDLPSVINSPHSDVAWDNVGNLYACDSGNSVWRVFSPPGANTNTTVAPLTIQIAAPAAPTLTAPARTNSTFQFTLNGQSNVTYVIQSSVNLSNWVPVLTNAAVPATRLISLSAPAAQSFYRAVTQ